MARRIRRTEAKPVQGQRAVPTRALTPSEELDHLFGHLFGLTEWGWPQVGTSRVPCADIIDRAEEIVVRAELPGIAPEDLDVSMTQDSITIKGSSRWEEEEQGRGDYYRREILPGPFTRTLPLPSTVDPSQAKASFRDGMLELTIAKVGRARHRNIPIE